MCFQTIQYCHLFLVHHLHILHSLRCIQTHKVTEIILFTMRICDNYPKRLSIPICVLVLRAYLQKYIQITSAIIYKQYGRTKLDFVRSLDCRFLLNICVFLICSMYASVTLNVPSHKNIEKLLTLAHHHHSLPVHTHHRHHPDLDRFRHYNHRQTFRHQDR